MAEEKRTLKIKKNDSQEEIEEKIEVKKRITEEEVRDEIDTNPELASLRTLLNNVDFINATGGRINKETVINRYMTNGSNSTDHEIDINHLLNITGEIIKVVSSELNGYVFNFNGTTDEELSEEQRIEMNILSEEEQIEKAGKIIERMFDKTYADKEISNIYLNIMSDRKLSENVRNKLKHEKPKDREETKKSVEEALGDKAEIYVKKLKKLEEKVYIYTEQETDVIEAIFIIKAIEEGNYNGKYSKDVEKTKKLKEECLEIVKRSDTKFNKYIQDENGNRTFESCMKGANEYLKDINSLKIKSELEDLAGLDPNYFVVGTSDNKAIWNTEKAEKKLHALKVFAAVVKYGDKEDIEVAKRIATEHHFDILDEPSFEKLLKSEEHENPLEVFNFDERKIEDLANSLSHSNKVTTDDLANGIGWENNFNHIRRRIMHIRMSITEKEMYRNIDKFVQNIKGKIDVDEGQIKAFVEWVKEEQKQGTGDVNKDIQNEKYESKVRGQMAMEYLRNMKKEQNLDKSGYESAKKFAKVLDELRKDRMLENRFIKMFEETSHDTKSKDIENQDNKAFDKNFKKNQTTYIQRPQNTVPSPMGKDDVLINNKDEDIKKNKTEDTEKQDSILSGIVQKVVEMSKRIMGNITNAISKRRVTKLHEGNINNINNNSIVTETSKRGGLSVEDIHMSEEEYINTVNQARQRKDRYKSESPKINHDNPGYKREVARDSYEEEQR